MIKDKRIIFLISDSFLRFAGRDRKGAAVAGRFPLVNGQAAPDQVQLLKKLISDNDAETVLVFPRRRVIMKYFFLASRDPGELRRMAGLRLRQNLPFPQEEVIFDIVLGETNDEGYTRVVAAVAAREAVGRYLAQAGRAGLRPSRCAVSSFGIVAWHAGKFPNDAGITALVINAAVNGAELCFCRGGRLLFARSLTFSVGSSNEKEVADQVSLTVAAYRREYPGEELKRIILTGARDREGLLNEILARLTAVPVEAVYENGEDFGDMAGNEGSGHKGVDEEFIPLMGLAYGGDLGPDLIPSSLLEAENARARRFALMRLCAAAGFAALTVALAVGMNLFAQKQTLAVLREELAVNKREVGAAERRISAFRFVQDRVLHPVFIADLMKALYDVIPEGMTLSSVQLFDGTLTVQGKAKGNADINLFQKGMMGSKLFQEVTLQYAQNVVLDYTDFRIVSRLRKPEEESP